ncbi:peptidyl-alpha-hydroxyglycine alpha-amidating lyase family protein [Novipirellula rosea]
MNRPLKMLACVTMIIHSIAASCSGNSAEPDKGKSPDYPRVNLAPWYRVDPAWPQKPSEFEWQAVPAVAVDAEDQVYVFTRSTPPIQVYTKEGKFVRSWGDDSIATAHHLKIDGDGNIWVADIGLHIIRKFSPTGEVLQTIGTPGVSGEDQTHLDKPTDMAIAANGDVFVSDGYGNNRIVHFDATGKFVKAWGSLGTGPEQFSLPHAIAIDSTGRLYIADRNNARVMIYDQQGVLLDSWDNVIVPWGFHVTADDAIWVCGASPMPWINDPDYPGAPVSCPPKDQVLMKFNPHGKLLQLWTIPKGQDGKEQAGDVNWLHGMAIDSEGDIYVGDIIGKRAQKFVLQK